MRNFDFSNIKPCKNLSYNEILDILNSFIKNDRLNSFITQSNFIKKYNLIPFYESVFFYTSFLKKDVKIKERLFCIKHNIKEYPKCSLCGSPVYQFNNKSLKEGFYSKFCSRKCNRKVNNPYLFLSDEQKILRNKKVSDSKKGKPILWKSKLSEVQKSKKVQEKRKKTNLARYGVENAGVLGGQYSKISQKLFWDIYNRLQPDLKEKTYFFELNKEFYKSFNKKCFSYDFVISSLRLCIEFNGDIWHANPNFYKELEIPLKTKFKNKSALTSKEIWSQDQEKTNFLRQEGFRVLIIWENDYRKNPELITDFCIEIIQEQQNKIKKIDEILKLINKSYSELTIHQKKALNNCICFMETGSHLYGTNTESSDHDYDAVFIEPLENVLGREKIEEVNFSTNKDNVRNTSNDKDIKFYSLSKFLTLLSENNPNRLELLFCPDNSIIYKNKYWDILIKFKSFFISLKSYYAFNGYAFSQRKKLLVKKKRYDELCKFKDLLEKQIIKGHKIIADMADDITYIDYHKQYDKKKDISVKKPVRRLKEKYEFIECTKTEEGADAIKVDDKKYNWGMNIENIYNHIKTQVDKYGLRTQNLIDFGFDVKFASHLFRLFYEGSELLKTGKITLPLKEEQSKFIKDIKQGKYDLNFLIKESNNIEPEFKSIYQESKLRHTPDYKAISDLQVKLYIDYWKECGWI